jgi:Uncharacterised nucleotidyltransferase
MFALTRDLAKGRDVAEIVEPLAAVQRHMLAPLAANAGMVICRNDLVRSTVAWARLTRDIPHIIDQFRVEGIRVIPIKGLAYAAGIYTIPAERPMTDVDLLVQPTANAAARNKLVALGFERVPGPILHHASTWVRGDLVIDLHTSILVAGRSRIDLDAVWSRAVPGWPNGAERLEPVDELTFHLLHMARNRLHGPLLHVVDATRLASRGSIDQALDRARIWGVGTAARVAWRFVESIVEQSNSGLLAPKPVDVVAMTPPSAIRKIVFDVATSGGPKQLARRTLALALARLFS